MKYSAQLRMGSREKQTSTESTITLRANRIKRSLDYAKRDNPLYVSQHHDQRQMADEERLGNLQHMMNHNEPMKDDGLVKHMRNLPGYLQSVGKGENILNFGVLDWGRLENWKSNEKRIPPRYNMKTSSSGTNPTLTENRTVRFSKSKKKIPLPHRDQGPTNVSQLSSSSKEKLPPGIRWPRGQPVKSKFSESSPCSNDLPPGDKFLNELDISKGKQVNQMTSEKETSSSDWIQPGSCHSPNYTRMQSVDDINRAIDIPLTSSSNDLSCSDSARDGHLIEVTERRLSECFSPREFHSIKPFSDASSDLDNNEQPVSKGRISSHNKRFSFGLRKMVRSFSFKESSSTDPQQSPAYLSVKSGPVSFDASSDSVKPTNTSRSSPLWRFLDPLLKLKGAHSTEPVKKLKLELSPTNVAHLNETKLLHRKKQRSSNVPALIQLTLKNGVPFFKCMLESSSDILAAAVKKLPSAKDDSSLIYAFYSVHETKKKNEGWMHHGSKEKSYGFGYDIVGQMKISSSYHAEFNGAEKYLYVVRESVLYSSDKTLNCTLDGELAAIVVKNPSGRTCGDIGSSKSTLVVLPEGVHSWPNGGVRSSLVSRWKYGGACDCGGWDVGCQFHVLSHQSEIVMNSTTSTLCTTSNRLDLCYKVGNKYSFRLVSHEDGLYSLDYDPSMSLLQAFSICVAVVSSQKLTHIFRVNYVTLPKDSCETVLSGNDKVKSRKEYFSKPPVSPVGRV
ncbi:uncharacterized protein [Rutidosis leptorrhynchoides]|uniref:uncharacterized protein n=1 Tax=Rutidosis leptorrhynchoides TaxID=125765 RepID=UPI003A998CB5